MIRLVRDIRLLPVVLVAVAGLFVLKVTGLVFEGGYTLVSHTTMKGGSAPALRMSAGTVELSASPGSGSKSWAQQVLGYPDVTGAVAAPKPEEKDGEKEKDGKDKAVEPVHGKDKAVEPVQGGGTVIPIDPPRASAAERALLERLHVRRQELDARARELEVRESLLKAAEKRLETRMNELKDVEARANGAVQRKDEAEAARLKSVVTAYENMKPREAARIFDRLDLRVLVELTNQINPRRMSDIMAQMSPEAAQRLTVELTNRATMGDKPSGSDLPKIEGRPRGS
jgi:flagellar motility protein MotE (MotC chaperone)